jgi:glycosyltransferase involved in cell wall biosynthesis
MNRPVCFPDPVIRPVLLCFSHLRWDFVFQRPQHLMRRAATTHQVFYLEEPDNAPGPAHFRMRPVEGGVTVLTPVFDQACNPLTEQRRLLDALTATLSGRSMTHWYYTPAALPFTSHLPCDLCIYDCMDELSNFRFAAAELRQWEKALLARADLVFTGGASLFAAKRNRHPMVRCYPSSVDVAHFALARGGLADPPDQAGLPKPRIGFFGVIDERMDLDLVAAAAARMPDVQFVMLGPVAKLDPAELPQAANLHWLGRKSYADLPAYMANWQAGWMPFALNDATRFISPTKTPEFLAAGLPVVSTAVKDVVEGYGKAGLVSIADHEGIAPALRSALKSATPDWRLKVDAALATMSWDRTWAAMNADMQTCLLQTVEA